MKTFLTYKNIIVLFWGILTVVPNPVIMNDTTSSFLSKSAYKRFHSTLKKVWKDNVKLESIEKIDTTDKYIKIYKVTKQNRPIGYCVLKRTRACKKGGCNETISATTLDKQEPLFEYFDMLIAYNLKHEILRIRILDYNASRGIEITNRNWLKQFNGKQKSWYYQGNIDAISGATVSGNNLTEAINQVNKIMKAI